MNSHHLTFTTDSIDVCINNYEPYSFEYDGWTVSDKYVHNEKKDRGSNYKFVITSPSFHKEEMLNNYVIIGQDIINIITPLIPVCGIPSLNYPKLKNFLKDQNIIDPKSSPQGWSSDYNDVLEQIKAEKGEKMHVFIECMGISRFSTINDSPLKELHIMLNKYDSLSEDVRFLIFLNYSILTSDNFNVFMLIGKALEIINAMYPFKHNHGKEDKRIDELFPELIDTFQGITIRNLMDLSNNRQETRHFIDKKNHLPHESLTRDERINLYRCSTSLMLNVLRDKFGLTPFQIVRV